MCALLVVSSCRSLVAKGHPPLCCCRLGLIPEFFKFLSLEHPNNNVHNIRMCHHVISSSALTQQQLREVEAVAKVGHSETSQKLSVMGKATLWVGSAKQQLRQVQARVKG